MTRGAMHRTALEGVTMRTFRVALLAALLAASFHALPVRATAFSTDQSDLWWNPAESGWGIQLVQRGSVIFATMFVYGASGTPAWYVATMNATGTLLWSGDLYATTGPWFGMVPFDAASVMPRKVGSMTWSAPDVDAGTLTYTVDGVAVAKNLVRQFIANDDFSGTFIGAIHETLTACTNPAKNGTFEDFATIALTQNALDLSFTLTSQMGIACTFAGTLSQNGRFGAATGTTNCSGKINPTTLSSIAIGINSIVTHFDGTDMSNGCVTTGYFAGARHR